MVAYAIGIWTLVHVCCVYRGPAGDRIRFGAGALLAAVLLQVAIGIHTLVAHVPVFLALVHQASALVVLAVTVSHAQDFEWISTSEPIGDGGSD
jgi:cytochrome c oxidase assembly protein subunit 15